MQVRVILQGILLVSLCGRAGLSSGGSSTVELQVILFRSGDKKVCGDNVGAQGRDSPVQKHPEGMDLPCPSSR